MRMRVRKEKRIEESGFCIEQFRIEQCHDCVCASESVPFSSGDDQNEMTTFFSFNFSNFFNIVLVLFIIVFFKGCSCVGTYPRNWKIQSEQIKLV